MRMLFHPNPQTVSDHRQWRRMWHRYYHVRPGCLQQSQAAPWMLANIVEDCQRKRGEDPAEFSALVVSATQAVRNALAPGGARASNEL
eukprot:6588543-Alexandrium_andersonii.AAC.1